jgi:hypothetical protein
MHAFLLVELTTMSTNNSITDNTLNSFSNSTSFNLIFECYIKLLCSDILDINLITRKCLLQSLKPPKKSNGISSNISPFPITSKSANNTKTKTTIAPIAQSRAEATVTFNSAVQQRNSINQTTNNTDLKENEEKEANETIVIKEDIDETVVNSNVAAAISSDTVLASNVVNEEDDMVQLAMALSLNEQQIPVAPQPLPRQFVDVVSNDAGSFRSW